MIRLLPFPLAAAGLFALWLLLSQAFSLGHVLVGGALSLIGGWALTTLQPPKVRIRRHRADAGCIPANQLEAACRSKGLRERLWCSDYPLSWEAIMRFRTTGILWLGAMGLAAAAAAQTPQAPAAVLRTVVAATKLPTVSDVPLYFKAVSVTLPPGESSGVSAAHSILYQTSGSTEVSLGGEAKMLSSGEGLFIATGKTAALKAGSEGPSTFLHFVLAPAGDLDRAAETAPAVVRELYRTSAPIPGLKSGVYDLNLTRVTFPAQMPSNPPHHRSGAALYYILSGTGANTVDGKTAGKGPGSLIYEPYGLVHQWGNPGNEPLTFLAFNINPEGVAAVLPGAPATNQ